MLHSPIFLTVPTSQQTVQVPLPYHDGQATVALTGIVVGDKTFPIRRIGKVRIVVRGERCSVEIETKTGLRLIILEGDSHARAELLASVITSVCNMEEAARSKSRSGHRIAVETVTRISGVQLFGYTLAGLAALFVIGSLIVVAMNL
jgi:hypothetical protein